MADVSPDSLRRFLLGRLPDAQMDAIGERLVADDTFGDEVAEVEDALVEAYLAGGLTSGDRADFERHYLSTPVHRARVETRRALAARTAAGRPAAPVDQQASFGPRRWMALAASVLLAVGLYWMRPTGTAPVAPTPAATTTTPPPAPVSPPAAPAMPTVTLTLRASATTRGTGTLVAVAIPRGTALVQLRLVGDLPPAGELTAEITAIDRDEVKRWPVDDAPPSEDGASRAVTVPPYAVPPGDYVLALWSGDADLVQRYAFRIAP